MQGDVFVERQEILYNKKQGYEQKQLQSGSDEMAASQFERDRTRWK